MTAKQPTRRLGLPLVCVLTGCVLLAVAATALYLIPSASPSGDSGSASLQASGVSLKNTSAQSTAAQERLAAAYGNLPLAFEANQGQTDAQVKYMARANGYTLFLTPSEAVLSLPIADQAAPKLSREISPRQLSSKKLSAAVVRMQMVGANPHAQVAGQERLPGVSNYFIGNDPHKWQTGVPQYGRVAYQDVYPGVNLAFHGEQRQMEFDFIVTAGADPAPIGLHFAGAKRVTTDDAGNLILSSSGSDVRLHKPVAYQEKDGARQLVDARFVVKDGNHVSFALGEYDRSLPLEIAPSMSRVEMQGPTTVSKENAAITDSRGWLFYTLSLPVLGLALLGAGLAPRRKLPGVFLTSLAVCGLALMPACSGGSGGGGCIGSCGGGGNGTSPIYARYLGGNGDDQGQGVAFDSSGNIYITGESSSTNFPFPSGGSSPAFSGGTGHDAFVAKLDTSGALVYSTFIGGTQDDDGLGIVVQSGNAFIVGNTLTASSFPADHTLGSTAGGQEAFVAEFNSTGVKMFATVIQGSGTESGNAIAVDIPGNIYVAGQTNSTGLFTSPVAPHGSLLDGFVLKLNTGGASLNFGTYVGGNDRDLATGIALDGSTNVYVSGITGSTDLGTGLTGVEDGFVAKFSSSTGVEQYFRYFGGSATTDANAIAVNTTGVVYITGTTTSNDLPLAQGSLHGAQDAFVAKINADATGTIAFSTYLGGGGGLDEGLGIALDTSDNVYVTGVTNSSDFPITTDALTGGSVLQGSNDAFITKLSASGATPPLFSTYFGGNVHEDENLAGTPGIAGAIAVDSTGNIYVTGSTNSTSGIPAVTNSYGGGLADAFAVKIAP